MVYCLMMVLSLQDYANGQVNVFKPAEEVVSIYGPNFITPSSREPYFIKIQRCVIAATEREFLRATPPKRFSEWGIFIRRQCYSFPIKRKEIEIVVADLNNEGKFYKYIVYNDTACACRKTLAKHYKGIPYKINESEFKNKLANNPVNLRNCKTSYCSSPQPRYHIIDDPHLKVKPTERYIFYQKCLPGCKNTTIYSMKSNLLIGNDTACSSYQHKVTQAAGRQALTRNPRHSFLEEGTNAKKSQDLIIIDIGSTKLLLAAFVLSVILLLILLVDCNLCCRKKGMMYSILCCIKQRTEIDCENCIARRINTTEV